jgi:CRISPR-associated exonuclease Cas4
MTWQILLAAALLAAVFAALVFRQAGRQRKSAGLPAGKVIYTDTSKWGRVQKPLFDSRLKLTGRPDYLVEQDGMVIPVEVKSALAPASPYDSHIYQLAAYCLLVASSTGKRPPYGILKYRNRSFSIEFTPELERELLMLLEDMRVMEKRSNIPRSHEEPGRCRRCGYRANCTECLE